MRSAATCGESARQRRAHEGRDVLRPDAAVAVIVHVPVIDVARRIRRAIRRLVKQRGDEIVDVVAVDRPSQFMSAGAFRGNCRIRLDLSCWRFSFQWMGLIGASVRTQEWILGGCGCEKGFSHHRQRWRFLQELKRPPGWRRPLENQLANSLNQIDPTAPADPPANRGRGVC